MRIAARPAFVIVSLSVAAAWTARAQQAPQQPGAPAVSPGAGLTQTVDQTPHPDRFQGTWAYNEQESVDAATGRPERVAVERRAGRAGGAPYTGAGTGGSAAPPTGGGYGGCIGCGGAPNAGDPRAGAIMNAGNSMAAGASGGPPMLGPPPASERARAEARDLIRDLMEIAESLTVTPRPDAMTFVDDLGRETTYPTDGRKHPYHVSAVSYDARVAWEGPALVAHLTGANGFKMTETFLVSSDANRLFVRLRIDEESQESGPSPSSSRRGSDRPSRMAPNPTSPGTNTTPSSNDAARQTPQTPTEIGANRVYDRKSSGK